MMLLSIRIVLCRELVYNRRSVIVVRIDIVIAGESLEKLVFLYYLFLGVLIVRLVRWLIVLLDFRFKLNEDVRIKW